MNFFRIAFVELYFTLFIKLSSRAEEYSNDQYSSPPTPSPSEPPRDGKHGRKGGAFQDFVKGIAGDDVWKSGTGGGSALGFENGENMRSRSETPSYNDSYNSYNNSYNNEPQQEE